MKAGARRARRLLVIVAVGGGVIGLGLVVRHLWLRRPIGEGPAGPNVPRELFAREWNSGEILTRCAFDRSYVHLVDMRGAFLGHGIHCTQPWRADYQWDDPHYWYYENLEDPNERGGNVGRLVGQQAGVGRNLSGVTLDNQLPIAEKRQRQLRNSVFKHLRPPCQVQLVGSKPVSPFLNPRPLAV